VTVRAVTGLVVVGVAALLALAGCGGGSSDDAAPPATTDQPNGGGACAAVDVPPAREDGGAEPPSGGLDPDVSYSLVFVTNCGRFTITLDQAAAPETAASLVSLARSGFYDDTLVHRIVPGFVIQGGDPTQTGSGGPGYSTVDPPPADATYPKGVVAMAKTEVEPPGTAGSQYFVVLADDTGLTPDYAVVGTVTQGMDVVEKIGVLGDPADPQGTPTEPVVVSSVTVRER
jgi:cyclophilin family peptidyl-prolyl cis-trans isomerase